MEILDPIYRIVYMGGFPKMVGKTPPKSSNLIGISIRNAIHFGVFPLFLETPIECLYGCFLKWWVSPTTIKVFLLKMIILGCFGGTPIFGNTHIKTQGK